jgi:hypothetical protein
MTWFQHVKYFKTFQGEGGGGLFPRRICLVSSPKQGPTEFGVVGVGPFYLNFTNLCELSKHTPPDKVRVHLTYPNKNSDFITQILPGDSKILPSQLGGMTLHCRYVTAPKLNLSIANVFTLFINLTIYARAINWFKIIRYILCM